MEDLSLHILDVTENAVRACASNIKILITEDLVSDLLSVSIEDVGKGMDDETQHRVLDPFFTTKEGKRVGLGLSLLSQAAQQTGGELNIDSNPDKGTRITAVFILSHPDMKPMGSMYETLTTLIIGNPSVRFIYEYRKGDDVFRFDSQQ